MSADGINSGAADISEDMSLETLLDLARKNCYSADLALIERAYYAASEAHTGQLRSSGDSYFSHPYSVACIVVSLGMDTESICTALLHDVVEDTPTTLDELRKDFGADIASLVDGLTKLDKLPFSSKEEQQAENLRKMLLAMAEDVRVIIIKLADRLHNMRTIYARPEQKQRDTALETLEVFAPLAHRLGIRALKEELEDLSIKYLDPIAYTEIETNLNSSTKYRSEYLELLKERMKVRLEESGINSAFIEGRIKSIHGIYRKMYMQGKSFEEIYDVYAVRIITDTIADCYNILGQMHDLFRPIPNRFKDYISTPKPNLYQSLHTTVMPREGIPFEIQIRTWEMNHTAEYGIAAHWKYKEGIERKDDHLDERLQWIRNLLDTQKNSDDVEDIVRTIKTDLSQEDVFVVTPKGDVINLPVGSSVIDFAYAIHSEVGHRMVGAKVDGRIVPLDYQVKTGEIIEVLTTKEQGRGPSRDWLQMVRTSEARNKIRGWFKKEKRTENIAEGKQQLERELRRNNITLRDKAESFLLGLAERLHCNSLEDFYASIGYGGILLSRILPRIKEEYQRQFKSPQNEDISRFIKESSSMPSSKEGVIVEGIDNCLIKLSRCCDPLPGDEIIGFITRGHGVSVHKRDCTNVPQDISLASEPERWVRAAFTSDQLKNFKCTLSIHAMDRGALLADITVSLANMHVTIHAINARETKDGNCVIHITISVENLQHLRTVIGKAEKINGVLLVERSGL